MKDQEDLEDEVYGYDAGYYIKDNFEATVMAVTMLVEVAALCMAGSEGPDFTINIAGLIVFTVAPVIAKGILHIKDKIKNN